MSKTEKSKSAWYSFQGKFSLWLLVGIFVIASTAFLPQRTAVAADVVVYKSPTCGCCKEWVNHMRDNGFTVEVHDRNDLIQIKRQLGVPGNLQSCHTAKVGGYVIEGHVPASDVKRLLDENLQVAGLTAPGMPMGSPGMDMGPRKDVYDVLTFTRSGKTDVFATHNDK